MTKPAPKRPKYVVVTATLSYPPHKTAKRGDVVDDIPADSVPDLLDLGDIVREADALDGLPPENTPVVLDHLIRETRIEETD